MSRLLLLGSLAMFAFTFACNDSTKSRYATVSIAEQDHAFDRGWLPEVVRPDATDIREFHDLDSNHGGATFHYTRDFPARLQTRCESLRDSEPVQSPFNRWPEFLKPGESAFQLAARNIHAARCGNFVVAIDENARLGYLWH